MRVSPRWRTRSLLSAVTSWAPSDHLRPGDGWLPLRTESSKPCEGHSVPMADNPTLEARAPAVQATPARPRAARAKVSCGALTLGLTEVSGSWPARAAWVRTASPGQHALPWLGLAPHAGAWLVDPAGMSRGKRQPEFRGGPEPSKLWDLGRVPHFPESQQPPGSTFPADRSLHPWAPAQRGPQEPVHEPTDNPHETLRTQRALCLGD